VFADKAHAIVGGSDHGRVYICDVKTGKTLKTLRHANEGGVETIAVQLSLNCKDYSLIDRQVHDDNNGSVLIATASSTTCGASPIHIWT